MSVGTKKQARKRQRQAEGRRLRNRTVRSRVRNQVKMLREALAEGDAAKANELLPGTLSVLDVASRKGVIHRNTTSRTKSRLASQVAALS